MGYRFQFVDRDMFSALTQRAAFLRTSVLTGVLRDVIYITLDPPNRLHSMALIDMARKAIAKRT